jgi:hypothetical protein
MSILDSLVRCSVPLPSAASRSFLAVESPAPRMPIFLKSMSVSHASNLKKRTLGKDTSSQQSSMAKTHSSKYGLHTALSPWYASAEAAKTDCLGACFGCKDGRELVLSIVYSSVLFSQLKTSASDQKSPVSRHIRTPINLRYPFRTKNQLCSFFFLFSLVSSRPIRSVSPIQRAQRFLDGVQLSGRRSEVALSGAAHKNECLPALLPLAIRLMSAFTGVDSSRGVMRPWYVHGVIFLYLPYFATMWP